MKVRMRVGMSGTYDGAPYPPVGELMELPEGLGHRFVEAGLAVYVNKALDDPDTPQPVVETEVELRPAVNSDVEVRPADLPRRGPGRPRRV